VNKEIVAGSGEEIEPGENSGPKKAGKRADKIVFTKGFVKVLTLYFPDSRLWTCVSGW